MNAELQEIVFFAVTDESLEIAAGGKHDWSQAPNQLMSVQFPPACWH